MDTAASVRAKFGSLRCNKKIFPTAEGTNRDTFSGLGRGGRHDDGKNRPARRARFILDMRSDIRQFWNCQIVFEAVKAPRFSAGSGSRIAQS